MGKNRDKSTEKRIPGDSWRKSDYKRFITNLMQRNCTIHSYRKIKIGEAFDYYYGTATNDSYGKLLSLHETEKTKGRTPFVRLNLDSISPKVNLLLGELNARGFEISVDATNIESFKRKKVFKKQLEFQMKMQNAYRSMAQFTGVEYGINENLPRNDEELDSFMETHKDVYELIMEEATLESIRAYKYEYLRKNLFLDLIVSNEVHCKLESRQGFDQFRRVNPLNAIYDTGSEDDFQSDMSFFLEGYYMNIPDAIEAFDIPEQVMKDMLESYQKGNGWMGVPGTNGVNSNTGNVFAPFEKKGSGWNDYDYDRVLIIQGNWIDIELFTQKLTHDSYDNPHLHNYEGYSRSAKLTEKEGKDKRNSLEKRNLQVVREATLIGGEYLCNFGKPKNQPRDYSNPETTRLNYISLVHNYNNGQSVSMVDRIKGLQEMKNYVLTIAQEEITSNIGTVLHVDKAKIDTATYGKGAEAYRELLSIAKGYGIVISDSSKDGKFNPGSTALPFQQIEGRSSSLITECLNVAIYLEEEMNKISGINEARMGNAGERQLSSVNAQKLNQSGFVTNTYFHAFNGFEVRLFEQHIYRIATSLSDNKERLEILAERVGVDLPESMEIDLQSYRVHVEAYPMSREDLKLAAQGSLNQGNLTMPEYLRIVMLANTNGGMGKAIRKYLMIMDRKEQAEMQAQQQQMQAQQQAIAEGRQYEMKKILAEIQAKNVGNLEKQQLVNEGLIKSGVLKNAATDRKTEAQLVSNKDALRTR